MSETISRSQSKTLRGIDKITEFLREELDEPDLPSSRVGAWARFGKIKVYRFGRNLTADPDELRASLRGNIADEALTGK